MKPLLNDPPVRRMKSPDTAARIVGIETFAATYPVSAYELQHPAALNGHQYLGGSVIRSPVLITGDQAEMPDGIGHGVEVDEDHLNAMA